MMAGPAQVTVNVGDGTNGISINTNKLAADDHDEGNDVTVRRERQRQLCRTWTMGTDSTSWSLSEMAMAIGQRANSWQRRRPIC